MKNAQKSNLTMERHLIYCGILVCFGAYTLPVRAIVWPKDAKEYLKLTQEEFTLNKEEKERLEKENIAIDKSMVILKNQISELQQQIDSYKTTIQNRLNSRA